MEWELKENPFGKIQATEKQLVYAFKAALGSSQPALAKHRNTQAPMYKQGQHPQGIHPCGVSKVIEFKFPGNSGS